MEHDAFRKAKINYSIRLVKKFVDAQRVYGNDWKEFNIAYRKLEAVCELDEIQTGAIENPDEVKVVKKARVVKKAQNNSKKGKWDVEPPKNKDGKYVDPKTGKVLDRNTQYYIKNKFRKAC